jgi:hypothetical protein
LGKQVRRTKLPCSLDRGSENDLKRTSRLFLRCGAHERKRMQAPFATEQLKGGDCATIAAACGVFRNAISQGLGRANMTALAHLFSERG